MIVQCPSCTTRYRHLPAAGSPAAALAECSRCDEQFPLQEAGRSYVLLPDSGAAVAVAPAVSTALPPGAGVADFPGDMPADDYALHEEAIAPSHSASLEFLVAVVPPAVGASVAYYLALRNQQDPVAWSALGGAAGFLIGWGCLLWIRRKD